MRRVSRRMLHSSGSDNEREAGCNVGEMFVCLWKRDDSEIGRVACRDSVYWIDTNIRECEAD